MTLKTDHSLWLYEEWQRRRERNKAFSMRSFARTLGLSCATLSQVIAGSRPLSLKMATRIADKLSLEPQERSRFFAGFIGVPEGEISRSKKMPVDEFKLIADWYHHAILALADVPQNVATGAWVTKHLKITEREADEALARLFRMGLIEKCGRGFLQTQTTLQTPRDVSSAAIRKYHAQNLEHAADALQNEPVISRYFSALTISTDPARYEKAKTRIDSFLHEMNELLGKGKKTRVYTVAVQMFPVSRSN